MFGRLIAFFYSSPDNKRPDEVPLTKEAQQTLQRLDNLQAENEVAQKKEDVAYANSDARVTYQFIKQIANGLEDYIQLTRKKCKLKGKDKVDGVFTCHSIPTMSIQSYLNRLCERSPVTYESLIAMLIYMDRYFAAVRKDFLNAYNVHRLILTSLVIANKYANDEADCFVRANHEVWYYNRWMSRLGGITIDQMNQMEVEFIAAINFNLYYSVKTYKDYESVLELVEPGILYNPKNAKPANQYGTKLHSGTVSLFSHAAGGVAFLEKRTDDCPTTTPSVQETATRRNSIFYR